LSDEMPGEVVSGMARHAHSGDHRPPDFLHSLFAAALAPDRNAETYGLNTDAAAL
jgi:hypothetical protein